uniref:C2H2-type domain-containing protein n=1 Tax=Musca domestica TaxID=7370 RepID=A0A1I8MGI7_MUSDO
MNNETTNTQEEEKAATAVTEDETKIPMKSPDSPTIIQDKTNSNEMEQQQSKEDSSETSQDLKQVDDLEQVPTITKDTVNESGLETKLTCEDSPRILDDFGEKENEKNNLNNNATKEGKEEEIEVANKNKVTEEGNASTEDNKEMSEESSEPQQENKGTEISEESEKQKDTSGGDSKENNLATNEDSSKVSEVSPEDSKDPKAPSLEENKEEPEKVPPDNCLSASNEEPDEMECEDVEIPENGEDELIVPDAHLCNGVVEDDDDDDAEKEEVDNNNDEDKHNPLEDDNESNSNSKPMSTEDESTFSNQEPELVAIEESINSKDKMEEENATVNQNEEDDGGSGIANDPLNCLAENHGEEETSKDSQAASAKTNDENSNSNDMIGEGSESKESTKSQGDNDEDDEVLFVETRNSPICIESDDEEVARTPPPTATATTKSTPPVPVVEKRETRQSARRSNESERQTINLPKATITVPKNLTITRTSARKSTARPPQGMNTSPVPSPSVAQQNRPKNFQYLQNATTYRRSLPNPPRQVVDTIELLDSSDEESQSTSSNHNYFNRSLPYNYGTPPKRTLMAAKNPNKKSPNKIPNFGFTMPSNFAPQIRRQPKKPAPPPLPPATPQSKFLDNFKLQPATVDVENPPAFSALLSNKNVIIPNAFYGNPPGMRTPDMEVERRYARWLEMFIGHFCNPQLVASHSCLSFLQKSLKYTDFVTIKAIRLNMNTEAQTAGGDQQTNTSLAAELRSIFLKNSKELTPHGRRFCELTCAIGQNKPITLLVHAISGKVMVKSCNLEIPSTSAATAMGSGAAVSANNANSSSNRKRQLEADEEEYVPGKKKQISSAAANSATASHENTDQSSGDGAGVSGGDGPKRSLRSKRTKRLDNSFSYNEDDLAEYDLEDEEEQAERLAREAVQRKIDQKRLEAQRQRQKQAQSFESAFLKTFARTADGKVLTNLPPARKAVAPPPTQQRQQPQQQRRPVMLPSYHRDAEEHLRANWIENVENEDTQVISDDDEPREHRIYKQKQQLYAQQQRQAAQQQQRRKVSSPSSSAAAASASNKGGSPQINNPRLWPKNTDPTHSVSSKNKDICLICKLNVQRIVHHYVNEHRGCEVYNSRLTSFQVEQLKRGACNIQNVSIYKNGQPQYEAHCIFCQKQSRFMFPYWVQHFTMHTGEYAYRCSACGIRKPTRSLLTQHQSQGCVNGGGTVMVDYNYDSRKIRVEARICTLCNYVQLHRNNIVKHLHQQHNVKQILPKHIQTIVLLKEAGAVDSAAGIEELRHQSRRSASHSSTTTVVASHNSNISYTIDDDDDDDDDDEEGDDDTLLFSEDALPPIAQQQQQQQHVVEPQQNQYYNYIPPYMMNQIHNQQQNFTWEDNDPTDDLSFMICGMLDVQMNNKKQ